MEVRRARISNSGLLAETQTASREVPFRDCLVDNDSTAEFVSDECGECAFLLEAKVARSFFMVGGAVQTKSQQLLVDFPTFMHMINDLLRFQLAHHGLCEVFGAIDSDRDGQISCLDFIAHLHSGYYRILLQSMLHVFKMEKLNVRRSIPEHFNFDRPTNDLEYNYGVATMEFSGPFIAERSRLDFEYHGNYTSERQAWQDTVIGRLMMRSKPHPKPWLVYTCGGYGAGKGYVFSWMDDHKVFPLSDIVCIDPDRFKEAMPEWQGYLQRRKDAGTLCHAESAYIQEIAQAVAMRFRQNIWVDGSLRNTEWVKGQIKSLKKLFPHYRIAIIHVYATEAKALARIDARRRTTGRGIPVHEVSRSLKDAQRSINELTSLVDLVVRIDNNGDAPILQSCEMVGRAGWQQNIARCRSQESSGVQMLCLTLAPLNVSRLPTSMKDCIRVDPLRRAVHADIDKLFIDQAVHPPPSPTSVQTSTFHTIVFAASCVCPVPSDLDQRRKAGIPPEAVDFCYAYPYKSAPCSGLVRAQASTHYSCGGQCPVFDELLNNGGFVYLDKTGATVSVNAICKSSACAMLQSGAFQQVSEDVLAGRTSRQYWHPIPSGCILQAKQKSGDSGDDGNAWVLSVTPAVLNPGGEADSHTARQAELIGRQLPRAKL